MNSRGLVLLFVFLMVFASSVTANIITNPGFESGTDPWKFYTNGGGSFTSESPGYGGSSKSARVIITSLVQDESRNVQLYQTNVPAEPNEDYQITFAAYSNTGRNMHVYLHKHDKDNPVNYGLDKSVDLTTSWKTFSYDFTTYSNARNDARLRFWLVSGQPGDEFWIDNVDLEKTSGATTTTTTTLGSYPPPIAHWKFDEGSGQTVSDSAGSLDGTRGSTGNNDPNDPLWSSSSCKSGDCLKFDGSNDRVDLPNFDISGDEMTIAALFNSADLANCGSRDCRIISKATGAQSTDHYWMLSTMKSDPHTRLRFRLKTSSGGTKEFVATSGNLEDGELYCAAAVYDGSRMRLYLNGNPAGSTPKSGAISQNSGVKVWIGDNPPTVGSRPFEGTIDEVTIWDVGLSRSQVQSFCGNPSGTTTTTTLGTTTTTTFGTTTTTSTTTTTTLDLTGLKTDTLFTAGTQNQVNIYATNDEKDTVKDYTVRVKKKLDGSDEINAECRNPGGGTNPCSHLIKVSIPSNKILGLKQNESDYTVASVLVMGPVERGYIIFEIEEDGTLDTEEKVVNFAASTPAAMPEFGLLGILGLMVISASVLVVSNRFFSRRF